MGQPICYMKSKITSSHVLLSFKGDLSSRRCGFWSPTGKTIVILGRSSKIPSSDSNIWSKHPVLAHWPTATRGGIAVGFLQRNTQSNMGWILSQNLQRKILNIRNICNMILYDIPIVQITLSFEKYVSNQQKMMICSTPNYFQRTSSLFKAKTK